MDGIVTGGSKLKKIELMPGREKSLLRRHPWIFSGGIKNHSTDISAGETIEVFSSQGKSLGFGSYSPASQIRVRMLSFSSETVIDEKYFHQQIESAVQRREIYRRSVAGNAFRLIHSESDFLPGVILDVYGRTGVLQLVTAGADYWRKEIISSIHDIVPLDCLIEKSDVDSLSLEGLSPRVEVLFGTPDPNGLEIVENGIKYHLDPIHGQKTGFYLDQRENRAIFKPFATEKKVLDCFCFSGGFSLNALAADAQHVTCVDSSAEALDLVNTNVRINGFSPERIQVVEANVFEYLRGQRDRGEQYDLIVLDPPKFAPTAAQVDKAARAYKDINLLACKLLKPGGMLFTFSCSGGVGLSLFQKIVSDAALDAGRDMQIIHYLHQAGDHPVLSSFPEGEYLKGIAGIVE
jgi:23S rRNA (cytosine1962-C5)-methyltransferase